MMLIYLLALFPKLFFSFKNENKYFCLLYTFSVLIADDKTDVQVTQNNVMISEDNVENMKGTYILTLGARGEGVWQ